MYKALVWCPVSNLRMLRHIYLGIERWAYTFMCYAFLEQSTLEFKGLEQS